MPFLAGGYHLSLPAKIAITNASFLMMSAELIDDEEGWKDNWEDTGAILQFAGTVYVLWVPPVVQGAIAARVGIIFAPVAMPAAIITSMVIVGGVVSYFIDPEEGLKNYKEFITTPGKYWERTKFTGETIYEHKIEPTINVTLGIAGFLYNMAERELQRRVSQVEEGMEAAGEWIEENNPFLTGPYLPF
jgi:hypothetical protein